MIRNAAGFLPLFLACLPMASASAAQAVDAKTFLARGPRGASEIRITQVKSGDADLTLALNRFEVFGRTAQLVADDGRGKVERIARPRTRYFSGRVVQTGETAFLAVEDDGSARGIVDGGGRTYSLSGSARDGLRLTAIDMRESRADGGFRCEADSLDPARGLIEDSRSIVAAPSPASARGALPYRARAAIETDYQFYQRFNDAAAATRYVGDLLAYASTKYVAEVNTRLEVVFVRLWTTASDPWNETMSNCSLYEFGAYWNANMTSVSRTFAHMLSGRSTGGGIAWVGTLCSGPFTTNVPTCNFGTGNLSAGGDYGFTGNISGNFNPGNPQVIWDIVATSHEIGHNFNSPHTHCYGGIGGNAEPIDRCYAGQAGQTGCYGGATSLPGPAGQGSGTIMSYCHLLSPQMANISLTFGNGHPYGIAPERVPTRMTARMDSLAQSNPACVIDDTVFADGFE
ncbi:MAG TPA: M12 family metallo-peptidase [Tahibacter sp.]|uniref:M12 family metallo-peptidase n=1 Tax=Tahibacter sp. TaxID=2056211 RepID=UPI002C745933|nr:M12 family metallo-peptidase [Tahibacter sp.]HSX59821.1 M12 family metallo-peptidase [Tahibacter sp.]